MIKAYGLLNMQTVIATETEDGKWSFPMLIRSKILPTKQVAMDFSPISEFTKSDDILPNKDLILFQDETSDKIARAYKQVVEDYKSQRSGIVMPKKPASGIIT